MMRQDSELRQDIVSGEWVLLAKGRAKRPQDFRKKSVGQTTGEDACPFEDPQASGNPAPLLWYPDPKSRSKDSFESWFLQVIPNKYPAVVPHQKNTCAAEHREGVYNLIDGVGYHEVLITRDHKKSIGRMNVGEAELVVRAYRERYMALKSDPCLAYILLFHNHGAEAGASLTHPHSQLIGLPIIPPDVLRSFSGMERFYKKEKACPHCRVITYELKEKKRIVYENSTFVVIAPYASHVSVELRIYPKKHNPYFEAVPDNELLELADALTAALGRLYRVFKDPPYNFFIHTAPIISAAAGKNYHWHLEILPKLSTPAGLELGAGVDVVVVPPEDVPGMLAV